jgi:hypothetical protein
MAPTENIHAATSTIDATTVVSSVITRVVTAGVARGLRSRATAIASGSRKATNTGGPT